MTFAACRRTDFDVINIDIVIMLLLLMINGSIVRVVVFLTLFVLLKAFAILVECLLVVVQFFAVFFLLAMVPSRLVALLFVRVEVQLSGWLNGVLQCSWFAIHIWVCWLLMLLLLLALVWGYLLYAVLGSICLLICVSRLSIRLSQRVSRSIVSLVSVLPGLAISLVLKGSIMVFIGFLGCFIRVVPVGFWVWSVIWPGRVRVAGRSECA